MVNKNSIVILFSLFLCPTCMLKRIFLWLSSLVFAYLAFVFFQEYIATHQYYITLLGQAKNIKILVWWLLVSLIPALYIVFWRKQRLLHIVSVIIWSLALYGAIFVSLKDSVAWWWALLYMLTSILVASFALYIFTWFTFLWWYVKKYVLALETKTVFDLCLNFGLGLCVFLLVNYVFILLNIFYPFISWLLLALLWWCIYTQKQLRHDMTTIVHDLLHTTVKATKSPWVRVCIVLLLTFSFWYVFQWFQLAHIPYSTAWDANHAYMFYPKMRALHGWYYRNEINMATTPQLWYTYIAYFFSLFVPFKSILGMSPDTLAIQMNFWSGVFVLLFGLWLISSVLSYCSRSISKIACSEKQYGYWIAFFAGWLLLILWLTSGMWAFLVFVDNKTDLWVLALIILAIYSWFVFLSHLEDETWSDAESLAKIPFWKRSMVKYMWLSWFFYAIAVLAKPTAMFDVANFALFLWTIWFGVFGMIGIFLVILAITSSIDFRWIKSYIPASFSSVLALFWLVGLGIDTVRMFLKNTWKRLLFFVIWFVVLFGTLFVVKWPYLIARSWLYAVDLSVSDFIKKVILSSSSIDQPKSRNYWLLPNQYTLPLLAQTNSTLWDTCTLESIWLSSTEQLYSNLQTPPWNAYDEDVGRYVWYGRKGNDSSDKRRWIEPFRNPWWWSFLSFWCHGFWLDTRIISDAKVLCEQRWLWKSLDATTLTQLAESISSETFYKDQSIQQIVAVLAQAILSSDVDSLKVEYASELNTLDAFMQENTIFVENVWGEKNVYVPYKYITPFNISFNRSLQNLSSYYTDIGIVRLILFLLILFLWTLYGLVAKKRVLIWLSLVTTFWWLLWWMIGGAILWYGIGIIARTIIAFVSYVYFLCQQEKKAKEIDTVLLICFSGIIWVVFLFQLILNMIRIASQWWSGAFIQYKTNYGRHTEFVLDQTTWRIAPVTKNWFGFGADDVFALQFPHYKKIIDLANERSSDEWLFIAWTYLRYFIEDQSYIKYDQFLKWLWKQFSDGDACKTYLRLKDQNIKYIVIDPNIGTVVQWAWNKSLFDRFFGKIAADGTTILDYGTMTMLAKLIDEWYLSYVSSNNIWAKYAYTMPASAFGVTGDQLTIARARMASARFFSRQEGLIQSIFGLAIQRVQDGAFVWDLADMLWLRIDEEKLVQALRTNTLGDPVFIQSLSQHELRVLWQYMQLRQNLETNPQAGQKTIQDMVQRSLTSGSQIIVLEVK